MFYFTVSRSVKFINIMLLFWLSLLLVDLFSFGPLSTARAQRVCRHEKKRSSDASDVDLTHGIIV